MDLEESNVYISDSDDSDTDAKSSLDAPSMDIPSIESTVTIKDISNDKYLLCQLIGSTSKLPVRGTSESAGLDLFSNIDYIIPSYSRIKIPTGLMCSIPPNNYGKICDKSSIAWKKGLHVIGGIIDADYRGQIYVVLVNLSNNRQFIKKGEAIAQMIIMPFTKLEPLQGIVDTDTERGQGGFGSTSM